MPDHWWFLPIRKGNVRLGAFFGLMHATTDGAGPLNGPWTIDTLLAADDGDGGGAWLLSLMAQAIFPRAQVWGDVAAVGRADAAHARRFFDARADRGSVDRQPRHRLHHGRWRPLRLVAGEPGRESLHPRPELERRDAPDRRQARRRDAAAERDARAPAAPVERPRGRAAGHRPHGRLLDVPDTGRQQADQHVSRQRPSRRVALHANTGRLHARARPGRHRGDRPRRDAGAGRADHALAHVDGGSACGGAVPSDARAASCSAPCFRSCSGWAACSSAS